MEALRKKNRILFHYRHLLIFYVYTVAANFTAENCACGAELRYEKLRKVYHDWGDLASGRVTKWDKTSLGNLLACTLDVKESCIKDLRTYKCCEASKQCKAVPMRRINSLGIAKPREGNLLWFEEAGTPMIKAGKREGSETRGNASLLTRRKGRLSNMYSRILEKYFGVSPSSSISNDWERAHNGESRSIEVKKNASNEDIAKDLRPMYLRRGIQALFDQKLKGKKFAWLGIGSDKARQKSASQANSIQDPDAAEEFSVVSLPLEVGISRGALDFLLQIHEDIVRFERLVLQSITFVATCIALGVAVPRLAIQSTAATGIEKWINLSNLPAIFILFLPMVVSLMKTYK